MYMKRNVLILIVLTSLSACSLTPDYVRPDITTPDNWLGVKKEQAAAITDTWWKSFGDDTLNNLMEQALSNNTDINAGIQVVEQSRAALKIAGASLWPTLNANTGGTNTFTNPNSGENFESERYSAGLSAAYELDLLGANQANKSAVEASFISSLYSQDALKLVVMADVAQTYFTWLNLNERLEIADQNLTNRREVLRIIQVRVDMGADSDLELSQQKILVASAESSRIQIIELIANSKNSLAILLGRPPQALSLADSTLDHIYIPNIATDQPSSLLERRPDLKAAEAKLVAANADIGSAKAAFYPSISVGVDNTISTAGWGDPSSSIFTLAAQIVTPIFQGGRLKGGLEQATAKQLELAENYRGAVYTAFQEVEDSMAAIYSSQTRESFLHTAMQQSRQAYTLSKVRYDAGAIDFQTLLDTQISMLSAEDNYAQVRLMRLTAAVNLYKAMGGGWNH